MKILKIEKQKSTNYHCLFCKDFMGNGIYEMGLYYYNGGGHTFRICKRCLGRMRNELNEALSEEEK